MYVIAGVTGRVGSAVAEALLSEGADVRVLVRSEAAGAGWRARGADGHVVDLADRGGLADALRGAAGFFTLLPFDLTTDNVAAHARKLTDSISGAVHDARVPHVVMLSSIGADLSEGTGPITGLYHLEQALAVTGTTVTAMRAGHFQEKIIDVIDTARSTGVYPVFGRSADVAMPMIATADLGEIAARALLDPPSESETVDAIGPNYTEREAAGLLGRALGTTLEVVTLPQSAWVPALTEAGFPGHIADSLAELYHADDIGLLVPRGDRQVLGATALDVTIDRLLAPSAA
ncbi:uncharacterized protein YbjT (DUF2867 family) [Stackebrandtia endophytica]|uniref:Uncharacterized protein YbjT (DUF2867 family) n=1 Tax=Stackebrandtia endophytica TaxID=1496996 RepID=A0A543AVV3_9ACTN|nr:NAD(P)H-binding protein [Stackebrandtia endophytica]TQL76671.1 uncharacterized protein YbjT (DUF2867 family) [Stackebrandtia endophytica]